MLHCTAWVCICHFVGTVSGWSFHKVMMVPPSYFPVGVAFFWSYNPTLSEHGELNLKCPCWSFFIRRRVLCGYNYRFKMSIVSKNQSLKLLLSQEDTAPRFLITWFAYVHLFVLTNNYKIGYLLINIQSTPSVCPLTNKIFSPNLLISTSSF